VLERLSPTRRNLALGALAFLLIWFSWTVRTVLNPLILGYLLAFVLGPMVRSLEGRGWGRRSAANMIFLGFFLAATLLSLVVVWQGRSLFRDVGRSQFFQGSWSQVEAWADEYLTGWNTEEEAPTPVAPTVDQGPEGEVLPEAEPHDENSQAAAEERAFSHFIERAERYLGQADGKRAALESAGVLWHYLRGFFGSLVALATLLTLLPIYAYFLLFELDRIHAFVYRYVPRAEKERCARIGRQVGEVLANFFRGRLLICVLKGGLITAGLLATGVPYAVFLGMGSGFLSLVPFVGPMLGFGGAFLLAAFPPGALPATGAVEWQPLAWALTRTGVVFLCAELIEGYVLLPKILGDSLGLHPVVVLASIFIGGAALGMFGFLIALPLTAMLVILAREMVLPALADFADEQPEDGDPKAKGKEGRRKRKPK
jgi:predicted PurR-regulated permease PerM